MNTANPMHFVLPVHPSASVGQSFLSSANPAQSSPPFAGVGFVQVRVRVAVPCKQYVGSEHALQEVHVVNPPSIAPSKAISLIKNNNL